MLRSANFVATIRRTSADKTGDPLTGDATATDTGSCGCVAERLQHRKSRRLRQAHRQSRPQIEGSEVVAVSDLYEDLARRSGAAVEKLGKPVPKLYYGASNQYKELLARPDVDAVVIATPWEEHAPMAIAAMKAGKHAFVEVPLANNVQELWDVVNTSEQTGRHCMMMENVNYGREELLYLNLVRQGIIGEILHGEAAYIHELRGQMKEDERDTGSWSTKYYSGANGGNLYPTHGLGPVAQYMNIARTDDLVE